MELQPAIFELTDEQIADARARLAKLALNYPAPELPIGRDKHQPKLFVRNQLYATVCYNPFNYLQVNEPVSQRTPAEIDYEAYLDDRCYEVCSETPLRGTLQAT